MPFPIVETVTVLSDIPWNIMTPQAGPSNLAYEIETHVGADPPVGIPRTPPTSTVHRIRSFMVGVLVTKVEMQGEYISPRSQPRRLWYLF